MKGGMDDNSKIFFLFFNENICCDPSLEFSEQDSFNDGSQNTFQWIKMDCYLKIISVTPSYLEH